nr:hypothetical protein [Mixta theicola]
MSKVAKRQLCASPERAEDLIRATAPDAAQQRYAEQTNRLKANGKIRKGYGSTRALCEVWLDVEQTGGSKKETGNRQVAR